MVGILKIASGLISPVVDIARGWQARKTAKLTNELSLAKAVTEAKIEKVKTSTVGDIAWENTALANAGIQKKVMMGVILLPMVLCFCGTWGANVVREGFTVMKEALPGYWEYAFYATISVSYGLREWADLKKLKKGI